MVKRHLPQRIIDFIIRKIRTSYLVLFVFEAVHGNLVWQTRTDHLAKQRMVGDQIIPFAVSTSSDI